MLCSHCIPKIQFRKSKKNSGD